MTDKARKPIDIPAPRPLSEDDRKRDLMRLISEGRSLLDPPPAVGATKSPSGSIADPHLIRAQNPVVDHGDSAAVKILASINPDKRTARIEHLRVHGNVTGYGSIEGGYLIKQDWPKETFATQYVGWIAPWDGKPVLTPEHEAIVTKAASTPVGAREARPYTTLSDSRLVNNQGPRFWSGGEVRPLPGSHRAIADPMAQLRDAAKAMLLDERVERQIWAQYVDTDDEECLRRLRDSMMMKCLFHARKLATEDFDEALSELLAVIERELNKKDFDPDRCRLSTYLDQILKWRIKDIRRKIRKDEKRNVSFESQTVDDDDIFGDAVLGEGEKAAMEDWAEASNISITVERKISAAYAAADDKQQLVMDLIREGNTQEQVASSVGVSQSKVAKTLRKIRSFVAN